MPAPQPPDFQPRRPPLLTGEIAAWAALLLGGLLLRWIGLNLRPVHHDESLFSYYAWGIYDHWDYEYQPILHGALPLYAWALAYKIFGDTLTVARGLTGLIGATMPLAVWLVGRHWSPTTRWMTGALIAASPVLTYYSRFFRFDVPQEALTVAHLAMAWCWWRGGRIGPWRWSPGDAWWACGLAATTILGLGIKENWIITLYIFFHAAAWWMLIAALRDRPTDQPLLYPIEALRAATAAACAVLAVFMAIRVFLPAVISKPSLTFASALMLVYAEAWLAAALLMAARRWPPTTPAHRFTLLVGRSWIPMVVGLCLTTAFLQQVFTHFGHYPESPSSLFRRTFDYWLGQHNEHRLKGPFHYYWTMLATYHAPVLLALIAMFTWRWFNGTTRRLYAAALAMFIGVMLAFYGQTPFWNERPEQVAWLDSHLHMTSMLHVWIALLLVFGSLAEAAWLILERHDGEAFIVVWAAWAVALYGYAGEKVPWIAVHQVLPILLLGGFALARAESPLRPSFRPLLHFLAALVVAGAVWASLRLNNVAPADPAERMVFNHTAPQFKSLTDALDALRTEPTLEDRPRWIHFGGHSGWPLFYSLRQWGSSARVWPREDWDNTDIVIDEQPDNMPIEVVAALYTKHAWFQVPFRQFWVPQLLPLPRMFGSKNWRPGLDLAGGSPHEWFSVRDGASVTGSDAWRALIDYWWNRTPWYDPDNPHGVWGAGLTAQWVMVGIRKELLEPTRDEESTRILRAMIDTLPWPQVEPSAYIPEEYHELPEADDEGTAP